MAVYIELTTDPFDARFSEKAKFATSVGAGLVSVRRPTRGLEIKDDTHAYIKLIRVDGVEIPIFDSSSEGGMGTAYANFILQGVQEQRMEKHQIVETFGDTYLFLFGESPRFLNVQAVLINSHDFNWKAEFMANYETYLRGTKAVEMGARTYLFYDSNIVEGYILNCQVQETSDNPMYIPLSFQFFVTNHQNISLIGPGSENFPIRSSALVPEGIDLTQDMGGEGIELLTTAQTNNGESSFTSNTINVDRTSPIRSLILDNKDEFTTALQPTLMDLADDIAAKAEAEQRALQQSVDKLESALANLMDAYGAEDSDDPFLMDGLGVGPTFTGSGVGIGAFAGVGVSGGATFGATASASAGAFAGGGIGIGARAGAGFSASGSAFTGVGIGASSGLSAQAGFGLTSGVRFGASASVSARAGASLTNSTGVTAGASAYASAGASSRSGTSFAQSNARASARAGGYASAGASLSFGGVNATSSAGSFVGARGSAGASVGVGGTPTAFSFVAAKGTLRNVGLPPVVALSAHASARASFGI